jgi:hypothetical protein
LIAFQQVTQVEWEGDARMEIVAARLRRQAVSMQLMGLGVTRSVSQHGFGGVGTCICITHFAR